MKVKDILPKKTKLETEIKNLQQLEVMAKTNPDLVNRITDAANLTVPFGKLMTELRMGHYDNLLKVEQMINEAVIQE